MLMLSLPAIYSYTQDDVTGWYYKKLFPYIASWVYGVALIAQTGSIYCTLGVTVERYIVVCFPLRSATICTYGKAKLGVGAIVAFSILYNIPRFFEVSWEFSTNIDGGSISSDDYYNVTTIIHENTSSTLIPINFTSTENSSAEVIPTALRKNSDYISIYMTWMYLVFIWCLPFSGLSVLNLLMFLDVRRSNKRQSTMSTHEKNELKLASMLMIVVVVFLICNILPLIVNILEKFEVGSINEVTETSNLLVTINSSVNFFIYIIFGERFKKQLCQCLQEKSCFKRLKNFWSSISLSRGHLNVSNSKYNSTRTTTMIQEEQIGLSTRVSGCRTTTRNHQIDGGGGLKTLAAENKPLLKSSHIVEVASAYK